MGGLRRPEGAESGEFDIKKIRTSFVRPDKFNLIVDIAHSDQFQIRPPFDRPSFDHLTIVLKRYL